MNKTKYMYEHLYDFKFVFYPRIADTNSKYPICLYDLYWGAIRHV